MRFGLLTVVAGMILAVSASAAEAANRFASPTGGTTEPCAAANPCDISTAVTGDVAGRPHDVTLTGGPYTITSMVDVPPGVTVHGVPGARPLIQSAVPASNIGIMVTGTSALPSALSDVSVTHTDLNAPAVHR